MWRAIGQAAGAIHANPLRSLLGALAIAVAVATMLIVNVALDGVRRYAELTTARTFGANTFLIAQVASPGRVSRKQLRQQLARNPPVTRRETRWLANYAGDSTLYAANAQTRADVSRGARRAERVPITGTTSTLAQLRDLNIVEGAFFDATSDAVGAQVAVIGADVADALFAGDEALGASVRIAGRRFEIIGVQGRVGTGGTGSVDKYVWIPLRAYERAFGAPSSYQLFAAANPGVSAMTAEDHARTSLRAARLLEPATDDNFDVLTPDAARGFVATLSQRIGAAAGPISFMALLAAIVVVTNTVLVSVTQRTREIGVRRALGARRADVINEVLAESTLLAALGGSAGFAFVAITSMTLSTITPVPLTLSAPVVLAALAAAGFSGVLAGWLPAMRAARIDVISALRTE